jgi:asparagine synthase (glutamine-hydrolysing)
MSIVRDDMRQDLFSNTLKAKLGGYNAVEVFRRHAAKAGTDDPLALVQYLDLKTYLVGDINTKVDRASMAHALEVREPLMDHPLVEWLASLPPRLKVRGQEGKWLLKKAMEPHLPHEIMYRPKMGFAVPLARWFRGPLRERVREAVLGSTLAETGYFSAAALQRMLREHDSGLRDFSYPLWTVLMFDAFLRKEGQGAQFIQTGTQSERAMERVAV